MTVEKPQNTPGIDSDTGLPIPADIVDGWESERDTERAKINVRGMAIALLLGALLWIRAHAQAIQMSNAAIAGLAGAAALMTVAEALYLWRRGGDSIPRWFKYVTVFGDMAFVSVLIYDTGGAQSPFFYVYFVFLISNCLRYGLLMSLFIALTVNVLYAVVLGLMPSAQRQASVLGGEGLKILAFWAVAFYGGSVSARLRRQATQLRVYEETLLELRARLHLNQHTVQNKQPAPRESAKAEAGMAVTDGTATSVVPPAPEEPA